MREMITNLSKIALICALCATGSIAVAAKQLYVNQDGSGVYKVYDPNDGTTVWVKDVAAYAKWKYRKEKIDGFGGKISYKQFQQGSTPVADATQAAAGTVNTAAGAAYNVANRVPSWRRYTTPLRALFGSPQPTRR